MTPADINLTIYQGATFSKEFIWLLGGTPVDLTGSTAVMQIRPTIDSDQIILTLSTATGDIVLVEVEGKITIVISAEDTADLTFIRAVYDLEIHNLDGSVTRLIQGKVTLSKEVTR
jgi:hypothetical protein